MLLVRVPRTDELIRVGPMKAPLWPVLLIVLSVVTFVGATGIVLARPLIRRLSDLEHTATRIAAGELSARADDAGSDAISAYAAQFNQMAERNQTLLEGQRDLMRGVSHELRTPVARIRFALELARESPAEPERERHLAAIDSDLGEIDELIQELLLVDRLSSNAVPLSPAQSFEVLAVVRDELDRERSSRPRIATLITSDLATDATVMAIGSERLFRRVVRNLVSNALKHARTRIQISVDRVDRAAVLRFDDDGPGVPASARHRILEPFVRLDGSRSRELGGVGLGLTIVDRILHAVGGTLCFEEAELGGARVTMTWPCDVAP